jgi:hypothetical protein
MEDYVNGYTKDYYDYIKSLDKESAIIDILSKDGNSLQFIKKQTFEMCKAAVINYGLALKYVRKQTPELCLIAVRNMGDALKYVKHPSEEIELAAVSQNGYAIEFVKEQSEKICFYAVLLAQLSNRLLLYYCHFGIFDLFRARKSQKWSYHSHQSGSKR